MRSFRLTAKEMNELARKYPTPFLVTSLERIAENYRLLREHLPQVNIYYAMKANPAMRIVSKMAELGAAFDVASAGELQQLQAQGIGGERIIYANPVKTPRSLELAARMGVHRFTYDDRSEIPKLAAAVPGAEVLIRVRVENPKALVDLNAKFGVAPEEVIPLLLEARAAGLKPVGIAFHVGSQSLSAEAYGEALLLCRQLFNRAEQQGLELTVLDIGGGFPVPSPDAPSPDVVGMMDIIRRQLDRLFAGTELWCEPGRYLCGTAVNLVTSVIGTKERDDQTWYILDEGIYGTFNGLIFDHWSFWFETFKQTPERRATLVGPSCDSIDFVARDILLPELSVGDCLLVPDCGAYSSAVATTFNGFAKAEMYFLEDEYPVVQEAAGEYVPAAERQELRA